MMRTYGNLLRYMQGNLGMVHFILFMTSLYLFVRAIRQKEYRISLALAPSVIIMFVSEQLICFSLNEGSLITQREAVKEIVRAYDSIPVVTIVVITLLIAVLEGVLAYRLRKSRLGMISLFSVKEAMDSLPTGILAYQPQGGIVFINKAMEQLSLNACNTYLVDGNEMSKRLMENETSDIRFPVGNHALISLKDGRTYQLYSSRTECAELNVELLLASDITEDFEKTKELREGADNLKIINEQLVEKNKNIVDMITSREILNAKVKIHNELGALSLRLRRYISEENRSEEEAESIREELQNTLTFLKSSGEPETEDECSQIIETAKVLGVDVRTTGEIPNAEKTRHILACTIHECLTNTLRHAHGDVLFVNLKNEKNTLEVMVKSNGEQPKENITERGGLKSLRMLVENAGGTMSVTSTPELILTLILPKEDEDV